MSTVAEPRPPGSPAARAGLRRVGEEGAPLLVVEDLLADPHALVRAAHAAAFGAPAVRAYPGVRSPAPRAYAAGLRALLQPLVGEAFGLAGWRVESVASDFSLVTRRPEALEPRQRIPHTDAADPGLVAVVHYLTPGGCPGTSFYRHRATGFERVGPERRARYEAALAAELPQHPPAGYIGGDTPLFERIGGVEGRFNRLVAYTGDRLHSGDVPAGFAFSADPRRGRLTVNTFLVLRPPAAGPPAQERP